jgi:hypothetical protein
VVVREWLRAWQEVVLAFICIDGAALYSTYRKRSFFSSQLLTII